MTLETNTRGTDSRKEISAERVRELLDYDPETGVITRRVNCGRAKSGSIVNSLQSRGYIRVALDGRYYLAHRVAMLIFYGEWPENLVDHINGIKTDNRIENLRSATLSENSMNRIKGTHNTSGIKGVCYVKSRRKWVGRVAKKFGHYGYIGLFKTKEGAEKAVIKARMRIHGEFANHGTDQSEMEDAQ